MTDLREVRAAETYPLFFSGELAENGLQEPAYRRSGADVLAENAAAERREGLQLWNLG